MEILLFCFGLFFGSAAFLWWISKKINELESLPIRFLLAFLVGAMAGTIILGGFGYILGALSCVIPCGRYVEEMARQFALYGVFLGAVVGLFYIGLSYIKYNYLGIG